jgi:peptide/nickel transport system permease protein
MTGEMEITPARSLWAEAWHRLRRNRVAMVCLFIISLFFAIGLLGFVPARWKASTDPNVPMREGSLIDWLFAKTVGDKSKRDSYVRPMRRGNELEDSEGEDALPRTGLHVLGTDIHGEDVLLKVVKGVNTAVILGALTAAIYIPLGLFFGVIAGYFGGWIDDAVVYVYSTLACIPSILLLIALMRVMGRGLPQLCIALGVTRWVGLCRLVRGQTLMLRESEYVLAARAAGASRLRIVLLHIVPNLFHIVIIVFSLGFGTAVLSEAVLSYIGLGLRPDTVSWGQMISNARMELSRDPSVYWQLGGSAGALLVLVLAFNVFGDALRDALDPKLKT